jgi:hypothetical protein
MVASISPFPLQAPFGISMQVIGNDGQRDNGCIFDVCSPFARPCSSAQSCSPDPASRALPICLAALHPVTHDDLLVIVPGLTVLRRVALAISHLADRDQVILEHEPTYASTQAAS